MKSVQKLVFNKEYLRINEWVVKKIIVGDSQGIIGLKREGTTCKIMEIFCGGLIPTYLYTRFM